MVEMYLLISPIPSDGTSQPVLVDSTSEKGGNVFLLLFFLAHPVPS
jgi:hypothetical protein